MKRLIVGVVTLILLFTLTACMPPMMKGGGWIWDSSAAHPITVDNRWGLDLSAVAKWNQAAGETNFVVMAPGDPNGANADVVFQPRTPLCAGGNCNDRRQMWVDVESYRVGSYVSHCVVYFDPTWATWYPPAWSANVIGHELGHCLDYPDVGPGLYKGVMSYENFYDAGWQAAHWWGVDDRQMLARDGYGP